MIPLIAIFILCPFSHNVYERHGDVMEWIGCTNDRQSAANMWIPENKNWNPKLFMQHTITGKLK